MALLVVAFAATVVPGPWADDRISDVEVYRGYAELFLGGELPYRDVAFEYPPLAALVVALPGLAGTEVDEYRLALPALLLLFAAASVLLIGELALRTGGAAGVALLAAAAAPLLTGAMVRTHFDLVPTALTLAALALLCAHRPRAGFCVLGLAVMTKGFPIVVAPVALAWLAGARGRRAALEAGLVLTFIVAAVGGAAVALSPGGALDAVTYHLERPVQIESAPAATLLALDALGIGETQSVHSHGSDGLEHPGSGIVTALFVALLVGIVALLAARAATAARVGEEGGARLVEEEGARPTSDAVLARRALVLASLAALAAFAALGKVLSPQFLVWVVPLAALALAWRMRLLAAAAVAAVALTLVEFPARYEDVVALEPPALWLVAIRDATLVLAVALAARELLSGRMRRRQAPSASP